MDDIIQVIAVLIFIFSIISSMSSKKKKEHANKKPEIKDYNSNVSGRTKTTIPVNDDYDVLREIENMFKAPEEKVKPVPNYNYNRSSYETQRNEGELTMYNNRRSESETYRDENETKITSNRRDASEFTGTDSEHSFSRRDAKKSTSAIHKSMVLDYDAYKPGRTSTAGNKVINEFEDRKALRKYLLYSEILGKPKAFS